MGGVVEDIALGRGLVLLLQGAKEDMGSLTVVA